MDRIRSLSSLRVGNNRLRIRVHVLRAWSISRGPSLELLLRDDEGVTIEATTIRDEVGRLNGLVSEFACYDIFDFEVMGRIDRVLVGWWGLSDSPKRLLLTDRTVVTRVLTVPDISLPLYTSFCGLMTVGLSRNPMTVHLLGVITEPRVCDNGLLMFLLKDLGGRQIVGSTYGRMSWKIQERWAASNTAELVCELRFWSLLDIGERLYVTTMGAKSDIVFNPGDNADWSRILARSI